MRRKDGIKIWALINATPLFDGQNQYTGTVSMIADITDRKRHELEMLRKNRDLETLLYITSHDLREPLRAIRNFAQLISERYEATLDAKGQDFLMRITRAGERMDRLIEDVLQLSRAQRKVTPAEKINGEILVAEAIKSLEARIVATNAQITVKNPLPTLFVDRFWARQALYNLISNALKFTRPDTPPEIEIAGFQPSDRSDEIGLVVRDRGIGLSLEYVERIFGLFQRAVGREIEGTGAGLAIVREVAERHGGRAWAHPRMDGQGGAEFFITFAIAH
jgi:light-regulated signal transduction histidine kinase (bacteriophytochrome)